MKKIAFFLAALMLLSTLTSCALLGGSEQTFEVHELSITLKGRFTKQTGFTTANAVIASPDVCVALYRFEKSDLKTFETDDDMSAALFATYYMDHYLLKEAEIQSDGDLVYISIPYEDNGDEFTYFFSFYAAETTYWVVEMSCDSDKYEKKLPDFIQWANSVTID